MKLVVVLVCLHYWCGTVEVLGTTAKATVVHNVKSGCYSVGEDKREAGQKGMEGKV